MSKDIVVYTAITGGYDKPIEDGREILTEGDIKLRREDVDNSVDKYVDNILAKHPKVLPHLYFPEHEYSIWIDGNVSLKVEPEELVETFLKDTDWAVAKHYGLDCAYDEGASCIAVGRGTPELIREQLRGYYEEGFPRGLGLWENCMIIRRHGKVRDFSEAWWENILRGSERDQISFPYTVWKKGLKFRQIKINVWDKDNPYILKHNVNHNED